jgi:hypothetical protein
MSGFKFSFDLNSNDSAPNINIHNDIHNDNDIDRNKDMSSNAINSIQETSSSKEKSQTNNNSNNIIPVPSTDANEISSTPKPPLHMLDIPSLLSTMKSSPGSWKKDSVSLSCTVTNTSTMKSPSNRCPITSTLQRIDIHQRPFIGIDSIDTSMMETDNNTDSSIASCRSNTHDNRLLKAEIDESDLIPGFYEGGLKVWECSIDLCNHLLHLHHANHADLHLAMGQGGKIMELGCGHGLPACLLVQLSQNKSQIGNTNAHATATVNADTNADSHNGNLTVVFTDYNGFVLRDVTLPNIILNCHPSFIPHLQECCTLIAGDWHDLSKALQNNGDAHGDSHHAQGQGPLTLTSKSSNNVTVTVPEKYHMILSAETTYTLQSTEDTASLLMKHLEPITGIGFVATKRYYFGVGGGSDAFTDACGKMVMDILGETYGLHVELVQEYKDGVSNIRDLWRVQCIKR